MKHHNVSSQATWNRNELPWSMKVSEIFTMPYIRAEEGEWNMQNQKCLLIKLGLKMYKFNWDLVWVEFLEERGSEMGTGLENSPSSVRCLFLPWPVNKQPGLYPLTRQDNWSVSGCEMGLEIVPLLPLQCFTGTRRWPYFPYHIICLNPWISPFQVCDWADLCTGHRMQILGGCFVLLPGLLVVFSVGPVMNILMHWNEDIY